MVAGHSVANGTTFFFNYLLIYMYNAAPRTPIQQQLCSRFQFQCHSGECIAVYNACDGIPQCVDGSDEGPEVHNFNHS